ncbi:uncharacterized protein LOC144766978 isoform X2 [Lissotriton helveticus]
MKATVKAVYISHFGAHRSGAVLQYGGGGRGPNRTRGRLEACGQDGGAEKGRGETQKDVGGEAAEHGGVSDSGRSKKKRFPRGHCDEREKGGTTSHEEACQRINIRNYPNAKSLRKRQTALPTEKPVQRRANAKLTSRQRDQADGAGEDGDSSLLDTQRKRMHARDTDAIPRPGSVTKAAHTTKPEQLQEASIPDRFQGIREDLGIPGGLVKDQLTTRESKQTDYRENIVAKTAKGLSKPKGKENLYKEVISPGEAVENRPTTIPCCSSSSGSYRDDIYDCIVPDVFGFPSDFQDGSTPKRKKTKNDPVFGWV